MAMACSTAAEDTKDTLSRDDWITIGLEVLATDGIDAVRITRLAEALGITRGSFYWHFKDQADLLAALIEHWQDQNTAALINAVDQELDLTLGIFALFDVWLDFQRFDPRLDSAMREWARTSEEVRCSVEAADRQRMAAIARLFERAGVEPTEAFIRARVVYFTQVGYYALGVKESLTERFSYLEAYFSCFTGRPLDPRAAKAYRKKHLDK